MKTIFTLLFATVFTGAFAADEGRLTITVAAAREVQVYVDGRLYTGDDNAIVLKEIKPGNHTIAVYRAGAKATGNRAGNSRNNRQQGRDLLYSNTVYVRPSYHVDVVVNRFGKALVDEKALADRNGAWGDDDWYDEGYNDGRNNGSTYYQAMNDADFSRLLDRVRNQWFGRLGNARDAIKTNYFTGAQTRQVLQLFSSESEKLELVKLAYPKLVDRGSFRQLYDLFSMNAQRDLDRFVKDYRF